MLRNESIIFNEGSILGMLGMLGMLLELLELLGMLFLGEGGPELEVGEGGEDEGILYYHVILFYLQIKLA
jgi:hypothetical protein